MTIEEAILKAVIYAVGSGSLLGWTVGIFFIIMRKLSFKN